MPKIKVRLNRVVDESGNYMAGLDCHQVWFNLEPMDNSVLPDDFQITLITTDSNGQSKNWGKSSLINNGLTFKSEENTVNPGDQYRLELVPTNESSDWEILNDTGIIGGPHA
ncbi:MAG: hypothetical protein WCR52_09005 [Bacteroidota bacterium]